ncbi:DNA alkylation repair protein [Enterococcus massiliensis]|uniref:DNA alkylation repair protein n=1 Tax=Enterococcus massiliensis TaxID=1640685 RepID=UPI00065DFDF9|nr:DNA alkylation repair protein [Enterococcus massiliensis]
MSKNLTATQFLDELEDLQSEEEMDKYQRFFTFEKDKQSVQDYFIGVRMGDVFKLAKKFIQLPLSEIEKVLESPIHEARVGAVSVMDWQARSKRITEDQRKQLFELYLRRHDRINNWDIVDRSAPWVVGRYLIDKPRDVLYDLAKSQNIWERRTAIVTTGFFIKQGEIKETFEIAKLLIKDQEDLIHKASGWMLRAAGDVDETQLLVFLEKYAHDMPRIQLRYAMEHLTKEQKEHFRTL